MVHVPPPSHGWPSSAGGHEAPKLPELPPPALPSSGGPHVDSVYDVEVTPPPLLPPLLLLAGPELHTPPSLQALPTSAGRQYTPDTIVHTPQSTVANEPSCWVLPQVACTQVAPPPQGCPTWARGHAVSAAAGWATVRAIAQTSPTSTCGLGGALGKRGLIP